jgi:hypothetical protein
LSKFFNKTRFFSETKKLIVGKILDLYTINEALSSARVKCSLCSLLFFFDVLLQTVQYRRNSPIYSRFISYNMNLYLGLRYANMISDGDSSAYEAVNALCKNLARSDSIDNRSSMDSIDENVDDACLPQLSPQQYKNNLVMKEDCVNHVKKHVSSHLKTLESRYSGFENVREENSASGVEKNKHIQIQKHSSSYSSAHLSSDDDDDDTHSSVQPVSKSRRRRLADGKPYGGGAGRIIKVMEHKLAECYGLAIRQSSESAKSIVIIP